jgi:predicted Zn-dependent peptidase
MTVINTLSNGLTIIVDEMPWMNHATVGVWVGTGALSESKETNGMAHFLEHMAFKGTSNRSSREIAGSIESRGGSVNAYTGPNRTAYYAKVLADDVPNALDLFADVIHNSKYSQEDIDMERNVIVQEIKMYADMAQAEAHRINDAMLYPNHPMGRAILGPEENVMGFKHQDFVDFVDLHYVPSNMFVCVAGPVDAGIINAQVEGLFGFMDEGETTKYTDGTFTEDMVKTETDNEQSHVLMNFKGVGSADPRYFTNAVSVGSIGGGMSARLFQEVREQRGLCYTVRAFTSSNSKTCGDTMVYSGTGNDSADGLVDVVADLLVRSTGDITQPEIDQAKSMLKASTLMKYDTTAGRIENSIGDLREFGYVRTSEEITEQIEAVDMGMVKDELQTICNSEFAYSVYGGGVGERTADELSTRLRKG